MKCLLAALVCVSRAVHVSVDALGKTQTMMRAEKQLPTVSTLSAQYFNYPDNSDLTRVSDQCNYYELSDLGKVVPDICCSANAYATASPPLDFSKDGTKYNCAPSPTDPSNTSQPWVRGFLGCVEGRPQFGETCVPAKATLGVTYPMNNMTLVNESYRNAANATDCNCGGGQFGTIYNTTGCVVAITSYMLGVTSDKTATFVKISGFCPGDLLPIPRPSITPMQQRPAIQQATLPIPSRQERNLTLPPPGTTQEPSISPPDTTQEPRISPPLWNGSDDTAGVTPETVGAIIGGAVGAAVGAAAGAAAMR